MERNNSHLHFITGLSDALEALRQCYEIPTPFKAPRGIVATEMQETGLPLTTLTHHFQQATVESEDDDDDESPLNNSREPPQCPESQETYTSTDTTKAENQGEFADDIEAEPMPPEQEMLIAVRCLLEDVSELRLKVQDLWRQYASSKLDLISVACAVNAGIDVVHRLGQRFSEQFPYRPPLQELFENLYQWECRNAGMDPEVRLQPDDPINFGCYNIAEWALHAPLQMLKALEGCGKRIGTGSLDMDRVFKPPEADNGIVRSDRDKWYTDARLVLILVPYLIDPATTAHAYLFQDHFLSGLKDIFDNGHKSGHKISLRLIFAAQCFVDTHYVLQGKVSEPWKQVTRIGLAGRQSAIDVLELHASAVWPQPSYGEDEVRTFACMVEQVDEWVLTDVCQRIDKYIKNEHGFEQPGFTLLRFHPLICGLLAFRLCHQFYGQGLFYSSTWGSLMMAAHLDNALGSEKACSEPWPAMAQLTSLFSDKDIFLGERPTDSYNYQLRAALVLGHSPTNAARDRRSTNLAFRSEAQLPTKVPLSDQLRTRLLTQNPQEMTTASIDLETLLNNIHSSKIGPSHLRTRLRPVEMVDAMAAAMEIEMPYLKTDLVGIDCQAWACSMRLYGAMQGTLVKFMGEWYATLPDRAIAVVVADLFSVANGNRQPRLGMLEFMQDLNDKVQANVLKVAGAVVDQFLKAEAKEHVGRTWRYDDPGRNLIFVPSVEIPQLQKVIAAGLRMFQEGNTLDRDGNVVKDERRVNAKRGAKKLKKKGKK